MPIYKNMIREYKLEAGTVLMAKKGNVYNTTIFEMASEIRSVPFPVCRWSIFTRALSEIDNDVSELQTNPQLKCVYHISGGFYISVTTGFLCVDFR